MRLLILYLLVLLPRVGVLTYALADPQPVPSVARENRDGSQLDPVPIPQGVTSQGLLAEARARISEKKWAEAVVLLRSHLGNDSDVPKAVLIRDLPARMDLVQSLMELGRREEALAVLVRLHERFSADPKLRTVLRRKIRAVSTLFFEDKTAALYQEALLQLRQRKLDEALQTAEKGLGREPDHLLLLLLAAQALILKEQSAVAVERLRDAEKLDPANASVLLWLGRAEMVLGDRKRALRTFEKAFGLIQGVEKFQGEERDALVIWLSEAYALEGFRAKGLALLEREVGKGNGSLIIALSWLRTLGLAQLTRENRLPYARQLLKRTLGASGSAKAGRDPGWLFSIEDLQSEGRDWLRALGGDA